MKSAVRLCNERVTKKLRKITKGLQKGYEKVINGYKGYERVINGYKRL